MHTLVTLNMCMILCPSARRIIVILAFELTLYFTDKLFSTVLKFISVFIAKLKKKIQIQITYMIDKLS